MRVALATCLVKPEPDPDEEPLVAAIRAHGVDVRVAAWDDAATDWAGFDWVVLRSTWNYTERPAAFLSWLGELESHTRVLNPVAIVRENIDKRYLLALAARGVATVPTLVFERGGDHELERELDAHGMADIVIKPVIGAASFCTRRFVDGRSDAARAFFASQLKERAMLVQPYERGVEETGERALVFIDGELTHAVRKTPRFDGEDERVSEALPIADDERSLAHAALAPYRERILYGRVDVVRDAAGRPQVMELELIEPSLFLRQEPAALRRLAAGIARHRSG